jgi:hypothetical protein
MLGSRDCEASPILEAQGVNNWIGGIKYPQFSRCFICMDDVADWILSSNRPYEPMQKERPAGAQQGTPAEPVGVASW